MIIDSEYRSVVLMYKLMYDKGFFQDRNNCESLSWFDSFEALSDCLDMIPGLDCDPYDQYIDEDGEEYEDIFVFKFSHPLIVDLGVYDRNIKENKFSAKRFLSKENYKRFSMLEKEELECIRNLENCFYLGSMYFSKDWKELIIVHQASFNEYNLLKNIIHYLKILKEMIGMLKKYTPLFKE